MLQPQVIDRLLNTSVPDTLRSAANTTASLAIAGVKEYPLAELVEEIERRAEGLVANGFAPGDRLGVWLPNSVNFVIWAYAAIFAGGSTVFIPPRAPLAEAERIGRAGSVRWIVGQVAEGAAVTTAEEAERRFRGTATLPGARPEQEAACFTTSGSTGTPKLTALSHRSWAAQVVNAQAASGGTADETFLHILPMCHVAFLPNLHANLVHGRRVVHVPEFDAREVLRIAGEEQVAYFSSAPTMLGLMLRRGSWPDRALRLRRISYGAAPMPLSWAAEVAGRFGCKEIVHGYGLTEGGGWVTVQDPRTAAANDGSVGSLMPGHDALAVLRPDGTRAAAGEEGEVCLTGPGQMLEYVGMPDETARVVRGGWVHTGDLGELDAKGELRITGRIKDQINRGGLKIGAREVETVIEEMPGVTAVAAVGVSDPVLGERVAAMVEARDLAADRVREHVSRSLADYKIPSPVVVVSELPRNALGKPDKPRIRHILQEKG